jgi:hypothetical protein
MKDYGLEKEKDLRPFFFFFSIFLLLIDTLVSLSLRGFLPGLAVPKLRMIILPLLLLPSLAQAKMDESESIKMLRETHLAYVRTNNGATDRVVEAGLRGLTAILRQRTAIEIGEPMAVNLDRDEIAYYPLLYWPVERGTILNDESVRRVNSYLQQGGMIIIDTREGEANAVNGEHLTDIFSGIELPPLEPMPADHVLTKSFYLLKEWPGRWQSAPLWIATSTTNNFDGVSPVIVGNEDWAGAWAVDKGGNPLFSPVPGGDQQREMARRFGVNIVMYALTGNYKTDQVHVNAILKRLGQ